MKKTMKKLLLLLLITFVGISLTACDDSDKTTYNNNTPTGSLSETKDYATLGNYKLSEKQLYNEMRVNAYDYLFDEIIKTFVTPATYNLSVSENRDELVDLVNEKCFGTSDEEQLAKINSSSKETYIKKFVDQMYLVNVVVTEENIYTDDCLAYFLDQLAQKRFAKDVLENKDSKYYWENETYKEDDEDVDNPYYISEETIESAYTSYFLEEATYEVVIVGYNTLAESLAALESYDVESMDYEDFQELYYNTYKYKNNDDKNFQLTTTDLSVYNTNLVALIEEMEAGNYLLNQQFGDKIYSVYLNKELPEANYEELTDEEKAEARVTTAEKINKDKLTSSAISNLLVEKVYESNVVIYDYVFDALFAAENEDHKRLEASEWKAEYNNYVAKVNDKYITVEDFYTTIEKLLGLTTAMDYFTSKVLLDSEYADKLTDEDLEEIEKTISETMTSFEEDGYASSGLPASVGKDVFRFIYFGQSTEEGVKEYFKSQKIWEYFKTSKPENYYELVEKFSEQYYTKYFDLSVKHILLTVDYDNDGTPDDPELYLNKVGSEDLDNNGINDYEDAIVKTMDAIVKEVNYIVDQDLASMTDALDYVLEQYYANGELLSSNGTQHWNEYKSKYNFGLTIEDLSSVNSSTASQYVKEFGIGVQELYTELAKDDITKVDEYLAEGVTSTSELIKTTYGYHILGVYKTAKASSAKYTEDNDSSKQYVDIEIKIDGEEVVVENAYSANDWASANQIKIYVNQVNTDDGVTDLPSAVKTYISKFYSTFTSRYESDTFQNILLAKTMLDIKFADQTLNDKYDEFIEIQKEQFDSYESYGSDSISFLANWWELVLPTSAE